MITLHYLENSRAQRILWLLEALEVDYKLALYHRNKLTMLAPSELKNIHPLGKSPVLTDGDLVLVESGAIVEYLIDTYAKGKFKPKAKTDDYLKYQQFMHYAEASLMPFLLLSLIFNKIKESPMPFFVKPVAKLIANKTLTSFVAPNISTNLDYLEEYLGDNTWFAGDKISGADFMMSFPIEGAGSRLGFEENYPNLKRYIDQIHALPSYQKALDKGLPYIYG
ncbi:MAG: glutathione S-transferase [Enterobacterales bacterium]|nr:glutathione S-transferase [Enterobacterales bacterium]